MSDFLDNAEEMEFLDAHPLDVIEDILRSDKVEADRISQDELSLKIKGEWSQHQCVVEWYEDSSYLMVACELAVTLMPDMDDRDLADLMMKVNPALVMGHFECQRDLARVVLRHMVSLRGAMGIVPEQLADIIENMVSIADHYYPAFEMVAHHRATAEVAYQIASFEIAGRA